MTRPPTYPPPDDPAGINAVAGACGEAEPAVPEPELQEAIKYLMALRDDLFFAGFPVPMPGGLTAEQRIEAVLRQHREACRSASDESASPTGDPVPPQAAGSCTSSAPDQAAATSPPAEAPGDRRSPVTAMPCRTPGTAVTGRADRADPGGASAPGHRVCDLTSTAPGAGTYAPPNPRQRQNP